MQSFLQFLIIGLGAGATYALFAQGAVLIYRGSGLVNFAQGAIGTFAAYIAFVDLKGEQGLGDARPRSSSRCSPPARCRSLFQVVVLRALAARGADRPGHRHDRPARPAPGRRRQALRRRQPAGRLLPPARRVRLGRASRSRRSGSTSSASRCVVTFGLWAWTRYTRVGLAINASAAERAGGADARLVARPARRAHLDGRRDARRARGGARRAAHRAVGHHLHDRGDRRRARRRAARRLPLVPADAARRVDHRCRRGDGHALRRRHHRLLPPGPHHRAQPHAGVPRDLPRGRRARPRPAAALARGRAVAEARHRRDQHPRRPPRVRRSPSSCCSG